MKEWIYMSQSQFIHRSKPDVKVCGFQHPIQDSGTWNSSFFSGIFFSKVELMMIFVQRTFKLLVGWLVCWWYIPFLYIENISILNDVKVLFITLILHYYLTTIPHLERHRTLILSCRESNGIVDLHMTHKQIIQQFDTLKRKYQ